MSVNNRPGAYEAMDCSLIKEQQNAQVGYKNRKIN